MLIIVTCNIILLRKRKVEPPSLIATKIGKRKEAVTFGCEKNRRGRVNYKVSNGVGELQKLHRLPFD